MKNLYIFVADYICGAGGVQAYVSSKTQYLIEHKWQVATIHQDYSRNILFQNLREVKDYCFESLLYYPFLLNGKKVNNAVMRMEEFILEGSIQYGLIVVESYGEASSYWAEALSKRIQAKHIIILLGEAYNRPPGIEKLGEWYGLYDFKYRRGELGGGVALKNLFGDYRTITEADYRPFWISESPVADVDNEKVEAIQQYDFNICHIGRIAKGYVPHAMEGVRAFSATHPDKQIQLIFVGQIDDRRKEIQKIFSDTPNLTLTELEDVVPIPRQLFNKVDVVIGCSGSARHSAVEKVPDVAVATNGFSNGLLGYETKESIYPAEKQWLVEEVLERALIQRVWENMPFDFTTRSVAECCEQNFEFIRNSAQDKVYYPEEKLLASPAGVGWIRWFKTYLIINHASLAKLLIDIKHASVKMLRKRKSATKDGQ